MMFANPFCEYLKTHYGLLENLAKGMGLSISLEDFSDDDLNSLLLFGVEGFMNDRSLIGTPESCLPFIQKLAKVGITEIACLIDFVQDFEPSYASPPLSSSDSRIIVLFLYQKPVMVGSAH